MAHLLRVLRRVGTKEQAAALLARDPGAHVHLDIPDAVAHLLRVLRKVGAKEQAEALAEQAAAHASLDNPPAATQLLKVLRKVGAQKQAEVLAQRLPAAGLFGAFIMIGGHQEQFRYGREPDGSAAVPWTWEELE
ncbi:hypothetical protein [Streptomyces sp. NPDC060027]|uniref:hypothetical protein n=1 Tax=Streptomyces sp. NPDC060027 TaxID=3347040 RepID=UPI0036C68315